MGESIAPSMPFPLPAAWGQKGFGSLRPYLKIVEAPFGIPDLQENHCRPHLAAGYICRRWTDDSPIGPRRRYMFVGGRCSVGLCPVRQRRSMACHGRPGGPNVGNGRFRFLTLFPLGVFLSFWK